MADAAHGLASAFVGRYFDPANRRVHVAVDVSDPSTVTFNISGTKLDGRFGRRLKVGVHARPRRATATGRRIVLSAALAVVWARRCGQRMH